MALVLADRVKETTTTTGTGAISLAGALLGYQAFSSVLSNADTTYYAIVDPVNSEWEVGLGTYASAGNALTRTTIYASSNAGSAVNLLSGTKDVFITYNAAKAVYEDALGAVTVSSLVVDGSVEEQQYSLTGTDIDPANGTIQYKTLAANTTFTESLSDGEYVTLMIDDGSGFTITWPTTPTDPREIQWVGGSAPTLETTGYNIIELWAVNGVIYGASVGAA